MELFKYNNPDNFLSGEAINGYDSAAWTEKYREPGTFEITGQLSSGLREALPIGTLVSHMRTTEIMIVENQQISEEIDEDPTVTISGRNLQALLEQRIVGQNQNWVSPPASLSVSQYTIPSNPTWSQAVTLINDHIQTAVVVNAGDAIPSLNAAHAIAGSGVTEARTIARGTVLERLQELLAIDNLGCRIIRRNSFPGYPTFGTSSVFYIYVGTDRTSSVIFSAKNGDIDVADYLWSVKSLKTSALVSGKFVEAMVHGAETGRDRRVMLVDGQDIDGPYETIPTGATLTAVRAAMTVRGNQALSKQKRLQLSRIDISSTPMYEYRRDYGLGDTVSVETSFGELAAMRVVEYVEIEDADGESAQPTLEFIEA